MRLSCPSRLLVWLPALFALIPSASAGAECGLRQTLEDLRDRAAPRLDVDAAAARVPVEDHQRIADLARQVPERWSNRRLRERLRKSLDRTEARLQRALREEAEKDAKELSLLRDRLQARLQRVKGVEHLVAIERGLEKVFSPLRENQVDEALEVLLDPATDWGDLTRRATLPDRKKQLTAAQQRALALYYSQKWWFEDDVAAGRVFRQKLRSWSPAHRLFGTGQADLAALLVSPRGSKLAKESSQGLSRRLRRRFDPKRFRGPLKLVRRLAEALRESPNLPTARNALRERVRVMDEKAAEGGLTGLHARYQAEQTRILLELLERSEEEWLPLVRRRMKEKGFVSRWRDRGLFEIIPGAARAGENILLYWLAASAIEEAFGVEPDGGGEGQEQNPDPARLPGHPTLRFTPLEDESGADSESDRILRAFSDGEITPDEYERRLKELRERQRASGITGSGL